MIRWWEKMKYFVQTFDFACFIEFLCQVVYYLIDTAPYWFQLGVVEELIDNKISLQTTQLYSEALGVGIALI